MENRMDGSGMSPEEMALQAQIKEAEVKGK